MLAGVPYSVRVRHWVRWSPQAYADALTTRRRPRLDRPPGSTQRSRRKTLPPLAALAAFVLALALLAPALAALVSLFGLHEPDSFSRQASLPFFQPLPLRYDLWYQADLRHLADLSRLSATELRRRLREERDLLDREFARLDRTGAYADPRGFRVYGPAVTGRLHALALARQNRQNLLEGFPLARLPGPEAVFTIGGYRLYRTLPRKFARQDEVVRALQGMRLPDAALSGYRVYLLPGSLGHVSGVGGSGYALLGGEPLTERLVDHQAASTVTHEFGHHLSLSRLGGHLREAPWEWGRYLKLRGIPAWREDGEVKTENWTRSPEETLAEDVRVLFGTPEAASLPYDAGYGDPRSDPALRHEVEEFLHSLVQQPPRPYELSPAPWVDDLGVGLATQAAAPGVRLAGLLPARHLDPRRLFLAALLATTAISLFSVYRLARLACAR